MGVKAVMMICTAALFCATAPRACECTVYANPLDLDAALEDPAYAGKAYDTGLVQEVKNEMKNAALCFTAIINEVRLGATNMIPETLFITRDTLYKGSCGDRQGRKENDADGQAVISGRVPHRKVALLK
ncbi:MAG TPA: hypothetical protein VLX68_02385 [Chitinivibrionales bacterium]|nr:hypothetical protein [Chitinivibrionales bacterium]